MHEIRAHRPYHGRRGRRTIEVGGDEHGVLRVRRVWMVRISRLRGALRGRMPPMRPSATSRRATGDAGTSPGGSAARVAAPASDADSRRDRARLVLYFGRSSSTVHMRNAVRGCAGVLHVGDGLQPIIVEGRVSAVSIEGEIAERLAAREQREVRALRDDSDGGVVSERLLRPASRSCDGMERLPQRRDAVRVRGVSRARASRP